MNYVYEEEFLWIYECMMCDIWFWNMWKYDRDIVF